MPYTPQTWVDGSGGATPLTAVRLNYMETGIGNVDLLYLRGQVIDAAGAVVTNKKVTVVLDTAGDIDDIIIVGV